MFRQNRVKVLRFIVCLPFGFSLKYHTRRLQRIQSFRARVQISRQTYVQWKDNELNSEIAVGFLMRMAS